MADTTTRSSAWIGTLNNPSADERLLMKSEQRWLRRVKGQDEVGASGTRHIQFVALTDQVRMSTLKRWLPRAHFEPLRTKQHVANSLAYVSKDETALSDTRFDIVWRGETQQMSVNDLLIAMYNIWEPLTTDERQSVTYLGYTGGTWEQIQPVITSTTRAQADANEYYFVMREYVSENPTHVSLFGNRMVRELWTHCRSAVRDWALTARQTRIAFEMESTTSVSQV